MKRASYVFSVHSNDTIVDPRSHVPRREPDVLAPESTRIERSDVENLDVSDCIGSHGEYCVAVRLILETMGYNQPMRWLVQLRESKRKWSLLGKGSN